MLQCFMYKWISLGAASALNICESFQSGALVILFDFSFLLGVCSSCGRYHSCNSVNDCQRLQRSHHHRQGKSLYTSCSRPGTDPPPSQKKKPSCSADWLFSGVHFADSCSVVLFLRCWLLFFGSVISVCITCGVVVCSVFTVLERSDSCHLSACWQHLK